MPPEEKKDNGHQCGFHHESFDNIKADLQDLRNHHKPLFREYDESRVFRQKAGIQISEIPGLVKFTERAKVIGVVASLIFSASFLYTRGHISESIVEHRDNREAVRISRENVRAEMAIQDTKLQNLIDNNEDAIDGLQSSQLIMNEKLARIDGSVFRIESRLSQLVEILADDGEVPRTTKLGMEPGNYTGERR